MNLIINQHNFFLFKADCSRVSVRDVSIADESGTVDVTATIPTLTPVFGEANRARLNIWLPGPVKLSASTTTLYEVRGWRDPRACGNDDNQFQTSRLSAMANFTSGSDYFEADVYSLISERVS